MFYNGEYLEDVEFDSPAFGAENEVFFLTDDKAAGWAMRKLAKIKADEKRMLDQLHDRIKQYTAAMQHKADEISGKAARESEYFERLLAVYFGGLPRDVVKTTKAGRISYDLPEGRLMMTAPKREYKHNDDLLLQALHANGMSEYIRTKEVPDWASIKKTLYTDENGTVNMMNAEGEIFATDAIVAVEIPGEFRVEVE